MMIATSCLSLLIHFTLSAAAFQVAGATPDDPLIYRAYLSGLCNELLWEENLKINGTHI